MDYYGTIGPSCADREILKQMKAMGMTGLRMNLSHGSLKERGDWLRLIREAGVEQLLIDLQGPELRVGVLEQPLELAEGKLVRLFSDCAGKNRRQVKKSDSDTPCIPCPGSVMDAFTETGSGEKDLEKEKSCQKILLDDGKILLQMEDGISNRSLAEKDIYCRVVRGGILQSHKSIALPGLTVSSPTLTAEDHENLKLAAESGVTGVMLPFVRGRKDILALREALQRYGAETVQIFAKIENLAGVESLPEFVRDVDHVVIARGDLGNAMPLWELPGCQKRIAAVCREAGTPFMVVTQMLDSMHTRAVPTRAEVSDIYNAVMDGAASVMLTGETAAGQYPVEAMEYLVKTGGCAKQDRGNVGFF